MMKPASPYDLENTCPSKILSVIAGGFRNWGTSARWSCEQISTSVATQRATDPYGDIYFSGSRTMRMASHLTQKNQLSSVITCRAVIQSFEIGPNMKNLLKILLITILATGNLSAEEKFPATEFSIADLAELQNTIQQQIKLYF